MTTETVKPCMCSADYCSQKCKLSATSCCWCLDKRRDFAVTKFVDGIGMLGTEYIPRDVDYCSSCRQTQKTFAVMVTELMEAIDTMPSKRREIDAHITELSKRRYRQSQIYLDSRRKVWIT